MLPAHFKVGSALRRVDGKNDYTHTLEEFNLVKISSNIPRETRFTNKLRVSFLVCFDDSPHQKVLKGSSLD